MTDKILFSNTGVTTITVATTAVSTSITVSDGTVFQAPSANEYQMLVILPAGSSAVDLALSDIEVVKLTANVASVLTVTRAQESTTGKVWPAGSVIAAPLTSGIAAQLAQGFDYTGNTTGTDAVELQSMRDTTDRVAAAQESTTVGANNKVSGVGGIAAGRDNDVSSGLAVGQTNNCSAVQADAVGHSNAIHTARSRVFGIAGKMPTTTRTGGVEALSLGHSQYNAMENGLAVGAVPFIKLPLWPSGFNNAGDVTDLRCIVGMEVVLVSHPVCIGSGPAWATAASKNHGDVVIPITPNNYSYYANIEGTDYWDGATTHATTEPTWPTTPQDSVTDNTDIDWICMDPTEVVYLMPNYTRFIPKSVGFITDKNSGALTGNPALRFGSATGTPSDWLGTTSYTNLGAAYRMEENGVIASAPASKILVGGVVSGYEATGNCTGRFFWRGVVVETMES